MKVLICGAGRAARTVLAYLGAGWDATVVAKAGELGAFIKEFEAVSAVFDGDASSPVVLNRANIAGHDWVLALTSDDEVNIAVARFAAEAGVKNIVGRAVVPENRQALERAGARAFSGVAAMAADIVQHLRNPRVRVIPVARDKGEILEIEVAKGSGLIGRTPSELDNPVWTVAAIYRAGHMLRSIADQPLVQDDTLIVVTEPGAYEQVCDSMECLRSDFPHSYGRDLLASLPEGDEEQQKELLTECMHLVQSLSLETLYLIADAEAGPVQAAIALWSESVPIRIEPPRDKPLAHVEALSKKESIGLAVVPWTEKSILRRLAKQTPLNLAHAMDNPLLVAKGSDPYKRILVPFTGTDRTRMALDAALQMAKRLNAQVTVALVREPAFLMGGQGDWIADAVRDARALAQERSMRIGEEIREGNPVLEIIDLARDYDLIALGSRATEGRGFLTPDVGEHVIDKAPCSVLVVTG